MSQYDPYQQPPEPPPPPDPYGDYGAYANPNPYGSAPTLTKVCAILNIVMAGLDIIYACLVIVVAVMIVGGNQPAGIFPGPERPAGPAVPAAPGADPPTNILIGVFGVMALFAFVAGVLKLVGGIKLLRRASGAWGFSLAGGIIGCTQLWCSYFCVLPLAIGIFTIVVVSLQTTRNYLRDSLAAASPPQP